jgi:site-specific DNA recombinase
MNVSSTQLPKELQDFYARDHSRRVSEGMFEKVRAGDLPGCPPVGYKNGRDNYGTKIVIDKKLAPSVKKAFYLAAEGKLSLRKILKILTAKGLLSRNGKPIGVSGLWAILTNPFYTGRIRYQGGLVPGNHEPMISDEIFFQVAESLKQKKR